MHFKNIVSIKGRFLVLLNFNDTEYSINLYHTFLINVKQCGSTWLQSYIPHKQNIPFFLNFSPCFNKEIIKQKPLQSTIHDAAINHMTFCKYVYSLGEGMYNFSLPHHLKFPNKCNFNILIFYIVLCVRKILDYYHNYRVYGL